MFIQRYEDVQFISKSAQIKLPRPNFILDPRVNYPRGARFDCKYHDDGITVTLTTIKSDNDRYRNGTHTFSMRVYDPANQDLPDFDSTIYTYSGEDDERAPYDTTVAIISPSVKTIKRNAFSGCRKMKKCIMHEGVETIEGDAFLYCTSLEALFLPSSIKKIDWWPFWDCKNIRILSLPLNINISQIGRRIIDGCDTFFQITQIPQYHYSHQGYVTNNDQVHQAIIHLYRNLPPLHRACLNVNVSTQAIHDCIIAHGTQAASITDHDGMTPLHILTMNPHATVGCIGECLDADMSAAFVGDSRGNTPLDYLKEDNLDGHTWVVTSLCLHREAYSSSASNNDVHRASTVNNKRKRVNWNKMLSKIAFPLKLFSCLPVPRRLTNTHSEKNLNIRILSIDGRR